MRTIIYSLSMYRISIIVLFLGFLIYGTAKYFFNLGFETFEKNQIDKYEKRINRKYDLKIKEFEFLQALDSIERGNTDEFEKVIFSMHEGIISQVGKSMELSVAEKQKLKDNLISSNKDITKIYVEEYLKSIKPLENSLKEDNIINFNTTTRVEKATSVISSHICTFSTMIFSPLRIRLKDSQSLVAEILFEDPCTILISSFMKPLSTKLIEAGIIKDFNIIKNKVEQNYSKMIAELATAEVSFTTTKTITKGTSFFGGLLKSNGTITYKFNSVVKAGFDLSEKLQVELDHKNRIITILLPSPKIFDPIISTEILKFDDQDLIKDLELSDLNAPLESIKYDCISYAESSGLKEKSIKNAKFILSNLFSAAATKGYLVKVKVN